MAIWLAQQQKQTNVSHKISSSVHICIQQKINLKAENSLSYSPDMNSYVSTQ